MRAHSSTPLFGLKQIVKQPTRKKVTLDLIVTNMSDCCNPASVISPIGLSDHNSDNWSTLYRTVTCEDKLDIFMKIVNTGLDRIAFFHVNLSN